MELAASWLRVMPPYRLSRKSESVPSVKRVKTFAHPLDKMIDSDSLSSDTF